MSLEHQMAGKKVTREINDEATLNSVKVGDQVSYVNENGEGREAHVKSISGETATLEVILFDGQLVTKSGVKYRSSTPERNEDSKAAPTAEVAAKLRGKKAKGGRRGKARLNREVSEDGRPLDSNGNPVARDIMAFHDTAITFEGNGDPYWHV